MSKDLPPDNGDYYYKNQGGPSRRRGCLTSFAALPVLLVVGLIRKVGGKT